MTDPDSQDFDSRFDDLRDSFDGTRTDTVRETIESFGSRRETTSEAFESTQEGLHDKYARSSEEAARDLQHRRRDFEKRGSLIEEEGRSLDSAEQEMHRLHSGGKQRRLLDRTGFKTDE